MGIGYWRAQFYPVLQFFQSESTNLSVLNNNKIEIGIIYIFKRTQYTRENILARGFVHWQQSQKIYKHI